MRGSKPKKMKEGCCMGIYAPRGAALHSAHHDMRAASFVLVHVGEGSNPSAAVLCCWVRSIRCTLHDRFRERGRMAGFARWFARWLSTVVDRPLSPLLSLTDCSRPYSPLPIAPKTEQQTLEPAHGGAEHRRRGATGSETGHRRRSAAAVSRPKVAYATEVATCHLAPRAF